eukprot:1087637-Rhodomonas_salina.1
MTYIRIPDDGAGQEDLSKAESSQHHEGPGPDQPQQRPLDSSLSGHRRKDCQHMRLVGWPTPCCGSEPYRMV